MRFLIWLGALAVLAVWSFAAWIVYGLSDWLAGLLGGALGGILSAEFGPWAAWIMNSLGDLVQFAILLIWGVAALVILAAPIWLGRGRQDRYASSDDTRHDRTDNDRPYRYSGADDRSGRPFLDASWMKNGDWKRKDGWRRGAEHGRIELDRMRHVAEEAVRKYRKKKHKKRDDDDD